MEQEEKTCTVNCLQSIISWKKPMSWELLNSTVTQVPLFILSDTENKTSKKKRKKKRHKELKICGTNYSVKINFKYTLDT